MKKTVSNTSAYEAERAFAAQPLTAETILSHRFGIEGAPEEETPAEVLPPQPTPVPTPEPTPEPEEPAVEHVDYDGPALPENATMDKYALGIEVMSPIEGVEGAWVSSTYGWREHPVGRRGSVPLQEWTWRSTAARRFTPLPTGWWTISARATSTASTSRFSTTTG